MNKDKSYEDLLTEMLVIAGILGIDMRLIEVSKHVYEDLVEMAMDKAGLTERPDQDIALKGPLYTAYVVPRVYDK